jgi:hypothetical protein
MTCVGGRAGRVRVGRGKIGGASGVGCGVLCVEAVATGCKVIPARPKSYTTSASS